MKKFLFYSMSIILILFIVSCAGTMKSAKTSSFPKNVNRIVILPARNSSGTDDKNAEKDTWALVGAMLHERTKYEIVKYDKVEKALEDLRINVNSINQQEIKDLAKKFDADLVVLPEITLLKMEKGLLKTTISASVKVIAYDSQGNEVFNNEGTYELKKSNLEAAIGKNISGKLGTIYHEALRESVFRAIKPFPRG